ncbi:MAG: hypothetical protein RLZZ174_728 [Pseudomonadota bacterium]|jgi:probable phosphoglycerate mutase
MTTRLWLVRHGQIQANVDGRWHGSTDSPLTDHGRRQVAATGAWFKSQGLPIAAVYASPLQRTFQTAEGIGSALGVAVQPEPALREYGIGVLEDTPFTTLKDELGFFERIFSDGAWAPEGGEAREAVEARIQTMLAALAERHAGEEIVVVSHGAALALGLARLLASPEHHWATLHKNNCAVSELCFTPAPELRQFNMTAHLGEGSA